MIVSRDTDGILERRNSWKEVKKTFGPKPLVILAAQHCKLEAWLLNGFVPKEEAETGTLREEKASLGFDPVTKAERLTARADQAKKSAKRVLNRVTDYDPERRRSCWEQTDLMLLRENGEQTGLKEFLEEVEDNVIPLIVWS